MLFKLCCLFFILGFGDHFCSSKPNVPEADTPLGRVRGFWKKSDGRKYAAFEGIPYAKPPVGDLRFEPPQPVSPWSGTWDATSPQSCIQADFLSPDKIYGQEDCLYINVYVPADSLNDTKQLDVIVVIHGGAFMVGSGHYALNTFLDKDVVLVSFNYRLGILGFLSTEDDVIPGNNGLKDQVLALEWVKDNIASFGGNPRSVTIVGLSAGGASVHFHYFSPLSKGLFVKGLSQSGTALVPWALKKDSLQRAKKLAVLVGCPDGSSEELKSCLKERPAYSLIEQVKHFYGFKNLPFSPFAPVVEKESPGAFLDKEPYRLLKEGKVHDVPWITSFTTSEGLLPTGFFWSNLEEVNEKWEELSPALLDCNDTLPMSRRKAVAKEILDYYLGPGEKINKANFEKFTQIFTHRLFAVSAEMSAKMQAKVTKSPVYIYVFNYHEGENRMVEFLSGSREVKGVAHGEDGIYFYGILTSKPLSEQDKRLKSACGDMLYSFASSDQPSFDGTDIWQPTGPEELVYLNVTGPDDLKLQKSKNLSPIDFWTKLGFLENEHVVLRDEL